jgi:hydroxypyruvate isomerase
MLSAADLRNKSALPADGFVSEVTNMDRRAFARTVAGATLGAAFGERTRSAASPPIPAGEAPGVPFKISVMLWTVFRKLPFDQRLENVAAAGYRAVELGNEYARWSEEDLRGVKSKQRSLGITFDCMAGSGNLADPGKRESFLGAIRQALPSAAKLECPTMICTSGNEVAGMSHEAQHQSIVEGLKRAAEIVEGKGVTLVLENIDLEENPHYFLWSVPEGFQIIREVNHPQVKFLYDFYHAQISGGNLIANLQKNVDRVGTVHIADVPGRHEPGTGEINYNNIYRKLAALNYDGYVAMEFIPTGDPVQSLKRAREEALRAASAPIPGSSSPTSS